MQLGTLKKIIDEMYETLPHSIEIKLETGNYICEMREAYAILPRTTTNYILFSEHIEGFKKTKRRGPQKF